MRCHGAQVDPAPELPDPDDLNNPSNRPGRWVDSAVAQNELQCRGALHPRDWQGTGGAAAPGSCAYTTGYRWCCSIMRGAPPHGPRARRHVRKQTCDLVTLMRLAAPLSTYYLFMEVGGWLFQGVAPHVAAALGPLLHPGRRGHCEGASVLALRERRVRQLPPLHQSALLSVPSRVLLCNPPLCRLAALPAKPGPGCHAPGPAALSR